MQDLGDRFESGFIVKQEILGFGEDQQITTNGLAYTSPHAN